MVSPDVDPSPRVPRAGARARAHRALRAVAMLADRPHRWHFVLLAAGAVATALYAAVYGAGWPWGGAALTANLGTAVGSLLVFVLATAVARDSRLPRATRRAWLLLAISYVLAFAGDALWLFIENVLHQHPEPSIADVPYLLSYPMLLAGALAFPRAERSREERALFWLDAFMVVVGGAMCMWYFIIYPTVQQPGSVAARAVAVAYPVCDLVALLGLATVLLEGRSLSHRRVLLLLAAGVTLELAGDLVLSYRSVASDYESGGLADLLWIVSYLLVMASAVVQVARGASTTDHWPANVRPFRPLPYLGAAAGYAVLLYEGVRQRNDSLLGLVIGAVCLTVLLLTRQIISVLRGLKLETEAVARQSEIRFRSLVQNSSDVIAVLDREGLVRYASASARRVLGYDGNALTGRAAAELIHPEEREGAVEHFRALRGGGSLPAAQVRIRCADERWLQAEYTGSNLLDDPGVAGIVINLRDVTERMELEHQLRYAQKMDAIGRLAGGVAHDFNNLLTAIRGNAQLLRNAQDDQPADEMLTEIESAADRAAALTAQLLAFSRKQVVQPTRIDLQVALKEMEKLLRRLLPEHIELRVDADPATPPLRADRGQLEQIVLNLAVNARDAMPDGGSLAIHAEPALLGDAPAAALVVSDTGTGMTEEVLAHIFEPFFTTKPPGSGTGLGLSTVYGIVEQSGGTIEVQSRRGVGSTFHVRLPAQTAPDGPGPPAGGPREAARAAAGEIVLLVEDEPAVRTLAERILRRAGYEVLSAADGAEALEVSRRAPRIDLLVTDVIMPGLGGPELARRLTADRPGLPVLLMSGYTGTGLPGSEPGETWGFVEKPFSPALLAMKVRETLDVRRS